MSETLEDNVKVIRLLLQNRFVSGSKIASELGITRSALHKKIELLRQDGLTIHSVTGKGYQLKDDISLLDVESIDSLSAQINGLKSYYYPQVDSTNRAVKNRLALEDDLRLLVYADKQTQGRGRRGKAWFSKPFQSIVLSWGFKTQMPIDKLCGLSLVAGITLVKVIKAQSGLQTHIKWPNDIYLNGEKLAGLLVELFGAPEEQFNVIVGLGINCGLQNDEGAIGQPWTSFSKHGINLDRTALILELTKTFFNDVAQLEREGLTRFVETYRQYDYLTDAPVVLINAGDRRHGIARGINEKGHLNIEIEGEIFPVYAGEVSVRKVPSE